MPGATGLQVAAELPDDGPIVVFVTAFSGYAPQAFDVSATDYVLKPFSDERFKEALERAKRRVRERRLGALANQVATLSAELSRTATKRQRLGCSRLPPARRLQGRRSVRGAQGRRDRLDRGRGLLRAGPLEAGPAPGAGHAGLVRTAARSATFPARPPDGDRERGRSSHRPRLRANCCLTLSDGAEVAVSRSRRAHVEPFVRPRLRLGEAGLTRPDRRAAGCALASVRCKPAPSAANALAEPAPVADDPVRGDVHGESTEIVAGALVCLAVRRAARAGSGAARRSLVDVEWLSQHLTDRGLVVLHVGDKAEYEAGHIPGARFITEEDVAAPHDNSNPRDLMLELPPVDALRAKVASFGISDDSRIVVYFGRNGGVPSATRIIFTLDYLGLGRADVAPERRPWRLAARREGRQFHGAGARRRPAERAAAEERGRRRGVREVGPAAAESRARGRPRTGVLHGHRADDERQGRSHPRRGEHPVHRDHRQRAADRSRAGRGAVPQGRRQSRATPSSSIATSASRPPR